MSVYAFDIATTAAGPGDDLLACEWLLTTGRGGYAASTVAGVNTRKYHGLLVAPVGSPGERAVLLSAVAEELELGGRRFPLGCFRFENVYHPRGDQYLVRFEHDARAGCVRFVYDLDGATLTRTVAVARDADAVAVGWEFSGPAAGAVLRVSPFLAYRHYHANRRAGDVEQFDVAATDVSGDDPAASAGGLVRFADRAGELPALQFDAGGGRFILDPNWWYRFFYAAEADRGEDPFEDLFTPGRFELAFDASGRAGLSAAVEPTPPPPLSDVLTAQRTHRGNLLRLAGDPRPPLGDLVLAADDFVATTPDGHATVLAGFPWFADWGRDAFIAMPGLLLATGRAEVAWPVLRRFAGAVRNGLVPNRFSDTPSSPGGSVVAGGTGADYNSVDASLWFIHAAFAWGRATGRWNDFHAHLLEPILDILDAFHFGTDHHIRVDPADGLLACGDETTQLTWMDAMVDGRPVTPRFGKPVEVNALYGVALHNAADRLHRRGDDRSAACRDRHAKLAEHFADAFAAPNGGLVDCIGPDGSADAAIRPNQILAVSLGGEALGLSRERQAGIVGVVREHLLTPVGLRTLSPQDPSYRGRCAGPRSDRDAAYHQGTAWAWLMGPFLEAYLHVHDASADARRQAADWLAPLTDHLGRAGVGQVSEIFDGDPPHTPRGCPAQAWSVAEALRLHRLIHET